MVLALLLNSAGFSSKKRNAYFQYDDSSALKLLLRQEDSRHGSRESILLLLFIPNFYTATNKHKVLRRCSGLPGLDRE